MKPSLLAGFDFGQVCFESNSMQVLSLSADENDIEFPIRQGPINFSVLGSNGLLSNRWGVSLNKKGDAYVYCRDVPDAQKVSLHASGRQHVSITPETAERVGSSSRFSNVWQEPSFTSEAIATFSLIFPPWGSGFTELDNIDNVELLVVGHKERLVVVGFFIVDSAATMEAQMPHFVLGELPLRPGKTLHIVAWKERQDNLQDQIRGVFPQVAHMASELAFAEGKYTLCVEGYRAPNSAYIVTAPIRFEPTEKDG